MGLGFADQHALFSAIALNTGCPNVRWVDVPRVGQGPERVAIFWDAVVKALMDPLTDKEKETGLYVPPPEPRISFTGTLLDAQEFYGKTSPMNSCKNCPTAQWTDGLPVTIPTEEAVAEMLTGTSHAPEEFLGTYSRSGPNQYTKSTNIASFRPLSWTATVEKIAVNAVMAGCKPEYLPVVLAGMSGGFNYMTTNTPIGYVMYVSGPIVDEIGMNTKQPFQVGNTPSMTIGRACQFCLVNIGGSAQGGSNTNLGNPANRTGLCFAEDTESLPEGWLASNQLAGYTDTESAVFLGNARSQVVANFSPSDFRNLNEGKGPLARALGVEGVPGKYNILQYLVPQIIGQYGTPQGPSFIMSPAVAQSLWDSGLKTKAAVGVWLNENTVLPLGEIEKWGWYDFNYGSGTRVESTTGLMMKDLPDTFLFKWHGTGVGIIVANSIGDETIILFGNMGSPSAGSARPVDPWR